MSWPEPSCYSLTDPQKLLTVFYIYLRGPPKKIVYLSSKGLHGSVFLTNVDHLTWIQTPHSQTLLSFIWKVCIYPLWQLKANQLLSKALIPNTESLFGNWHSWPLRLFVVYAGTQAWLSWAQPTNTSNASNQIVKIRALFFLISPFDSPDAPPPTWEQLEKGLVAVKTVVHGLVDFIQNHSKKGADPQQVSLLIGPHIGPIPWMLLNECRLHPQDIIVQTPPSLKHQKREYLLEECWSWLQ